jgi:hypothetical protein
MKQTYRTTEEWENRPGDSVMSDHAMEIRALQSRRITQSRPDKGVYTLKTFSPFQCIIMELVRSILPR